MAKATALSGKKQSTGNTRSHSNRATKRTWKPNTTTKTIIDPTTGTKLKVKISARAQKTLLKNPSKFKKELAEAVKKQMKRTAKKK